MIDPEMEQKIYFSARHPQLSEAIPQLSEDQLTAVICILKDYRAAFICMHNIFSWCI